MFFYCYSNNVLEWLSHIVELLSFIAYHFLDCSSQHKYDCGDFILQKKYSAASIGDLTYASTKLDFGFLEQLFQIVALHNLGAYKAGRSVRKEKPFSLLQPVAEFMKKWSVSKGGRIVKDFLFKKHGTIRQAWVSDILSKSYPCPY